MSLVQARLMLLPLVASLAAVGCGEGSHALSPTGPSGNTGSATKVAISDGATETLGFVSASGDLPALETAKGSDKGKGSDRSEREDQDEERGKPDKGVKGALSGFVTFVDATSLTVRGISVTLGPGAVIRHGHRTLTLADIHVGDHVQARGAMVAGALVATEIKVENTSRNDDDDDDDDEARSLFGVEGVVSGITATTACPALTFMVGTTSVTTSATTEFDGMLCTALANGLVVEVKGVRQTDGSVLATKVEIEESDEDEAKVEGLVAGRAGDTCPALTLTVGTTAVTTTAATKFEDVTCAALADGMRVEAKGVRQPDGSIAATKIELD